MEDLTGKQLGKYQIISPLGQGGMAAVYKAFQPGTERNVALKILPRHYANEPEFLDRFKQEATIIAKFQHPHILPVFDYGEDDGYTYLVMPYIRSGTLAELMVGQPLALWRIRDIISQTGDALDYAHSYGVVHRDVKPSNILIDERDNCLLTDFGIAKIIGGTAQFTSIGHTIGTPAYMSPEQIDPGRIQNEELDGRSDIYSLGIVLYELATGRTPYRAETPPALFVKHLYDPLPPPTKINPDLPETIGNVILKALAKDREDRYETAGNMVRSVQEAIEVDLAEVTRSRMKDAAKTAAVIDPVALALGSAKPEPAAVPAEPLVEPQPLFKRRTWLIAAVGLIAVAAIAIILLFGGILSDDPQADGEDIQVAEVIPTEMVAEVAAEPTKSATEVPATQPTAEAQVIDPTPTAVDEDILEVVPVGGILFEDDFETGTVANWNYLSDGFEVVQDESGNRVLQLGPSASTDAELGDSSWRDYALEFRVKVLDTSDSGDIWIHPRHNQAHTTCTPYTVFFNIGDNQDSRIEREISTENGCEAVLLDRAEDLNLETDRWYSLRVEVLGPQIVVYVDGQQVLQVGDSEYPLSGPLRFSKSEDGLIYYDDLRVTQLPYATTSSSSYVEGKVLFEDDFESGEPVNWDWMVDGAFIAVTDETGNQVLQTDSDEWGSIVVGDDKWSDYTFEFRTRVLELTDTGEHELGPWVRYAVRSDRCEYYVFAIQAGEQKGGWLDKGGRGECEAISLDGDPGLSLERDRWYTILIEAAGPNINVFLDGELILTGEDPDPILTGGIILASPPGAVVQYDDVRIVEFLPGQIPADESLASFEETILFEDDFESGLADDWDYIPQGFEVVRDETGNSLLRATAADWGFARVQGADWQDYAVDFKVKLIDLSDQNLGRGMSVGIRDLVTFEGCSYYTIWTDMFYETGGLGREGDSGCDELAMDTNQLLIMEAERWYSVRIEAVGGKISAFLDGKLILSGEDPAPILSGGIWIGIGPDTTTEYDDIRVTALVPDRPDKFLRMATDSARNDPETAFAVAALEAAVDRAPTYQDDFSDPLTSRFIEEGNVAGRFTNGSYSIVTDPEMDSYLDAGDGVSPNHSNIVLQSDIRLDPLLEGQARIFLRQSEEGQYEFVFYHADQEFFSQLSYGTPDSSIDLMPISHGNDLGSWHNFVAVLVEHQVAYFLDGKLVLADTRDDSSEGLFKIDAMPGTAFWIDNLRIWELDG